MVCAARGRRGRSVRRAPVPLPCRWRVPSCVKPTKPQGAGRLWPCWAAALWAQRPPARTHVLAGARAHPPACSRSSRRGETRSAAEREGTPRTTAARERPPEAAPSRGLRRLCATPPSTPSGRCWCPGRRPAWRGVQHGGPPGGGTGWPWPGASAAAPCPRDAALPPSESSASVHLPTARHERLAVRPLVSPFPVQRVGCIGRRRLSHGHAGAVVCVLGGCTPAEPAATPPRARMLGLPSLVGDPVGLCDRARWRGDALPGASGRRPADSLSTLHPRGGPRGGHDAGLPGG